MTWLPVDLGKRTGWHRGLPRHGRLPPAQDHSLGLFLNDCRYLRAQELRINGALPRLLVASDALGSGAVHELTNPDIVLDDGGVLPLQSLQIRIERRVTGPRSLEERIHVRSYHREERRLEFEPMFAVRGIVERPAPREIERRATGEGVLFSAVGRDDIERSTEVTASPSPEPGADAATLRFPLTIPPAGAAAAAGCGIATGDRRCGLRAVHQPAAS